MKRSYQIYVNMWKSSPKNQDQLRRIFETGLKLARWHLKQDWDHKMISWRDLPRQTKLLDNNLCEANLPDWLTAEDTHRRTYLKGSWSRNNKKCYILHTCNTLIVIPLMSSTLWLSLHNAEGKGRCHINVPLLKGDKTQTQCQIIKFYKQ